MTQYYLTREDELYHYGAKGQKWGLRRWQNEDGSLTPAGREHYGYGAKAEYKNRVGIAKANYKNALIKSVKSNSDSKGNMTKAQIKKFDEESKKLGKQLAEEKKAAKQEYKNSDEYKARQEKIKKAAKIGAAVVATAVAAYGAYKVHEIIKQKQYDKAMNLVKTAKFQDTLHGRYRDIAANYGTNYRTRYDGINGIKKDTYDYNMSSGPTTKLEYNVDKYRKYYDKAESARIKSGTAANKANSQYIKYLGGSLTSKGRKLKKDLVNGNSSFDANNVRKYRNAG